MRGKCAAVLLDRSTSSPSMTIVIIIITNTVIKKPFLLMIITMSIIIIIKGWSCFPSACNSPGKLKTEPWTFHPGQDTNTKTNTRRHANANTDANENSDIYLMARWSSSYHTLSLVREQSQGRTPMQRLIGSYAYAYAYKCFCLCKDRYVLLLMPMPMSFLAKTDRFLCFSKGRQVLISD